MAITDYDFTQTRNQVVERALRIVGALALGEVMSAEQLAQGSQALNNIVKGWQCKRTFLWSETVQEFTLIAGDERYALENDPAVLSLEKAFWIDSSNYANPVEIVSFQELNSEMDILTATGSPEKIAVSAGDVYVYPTPTVSEAGQKIRYLAIKRLQDWDLASSTGDFGGQWGDALTYALAAHLGDEYGLPVSERDSLMGKAEKLFIEARRGDSGKVAQFVRGAY